MSLGRKTQENLTNKERDRMGKIKDKNFCTAKAYQMRMVLQDIYRSADAGTARHRFKVWCRWVRWVARFYKTSLFLSMVKLAGMIQSHLVGILAHWKWGVTNAFMEGLNSVFSATKRKARGYRSTVYLTTMLYFVAGKLRLPQFKSHRKQRRTANRAHRRKDRTAKPPEFHRWSQLNRLGPRVLASR